VIYASVPELPRKNKFELHEGHAFGDDGEGDETVPKKFAEVVDRGVIDFVDAKRQAVRSVVGNEFALVGVHLLDRVVQLLWESGVREFRARARERLAGKPAALIVGVKNLEIASFDFDNQPQLFRELKLVSIVAGSAVDKIADVDWSGLQSLLSRLLQRADELRNRFQIDVRIRSARLAIRISPQLELPERHFQRVVSQQAS
jgi:hypothetical protein